MDVLTPTLVRIGNRCYRKYTVENEPAEDTEDTYTSDRFDHDHDDEEYESADSDIEETQHGFRMELDIPNNFFKYIIGKKGETKKKIENETRTQIHIPRQGSEGRIVVQGRDRRGLSSVKTRINILVDSARQREPFTHFLSIPVARDNIADKFLEFKEDVCRFCSGDRGIDDTIFQNPHKLHMTLGTLVLLNDAEINKARNLLDQCKTDIVEPLLEAIPLMARVQGLEYMNDDPCAVDVLYAKIHLQDDSNRLQMLADQIVDRFTKTGLMQQSYDRVKLHITIMNTLMRKDPSGTSTVFSSNKKTSGASESSRRGGGERESFDASQVLKLYGQYEFGTLHINSVHISQRYGTACNGYYACESQLPLP